MFGYFTAAFLAGLLGSVHCVGMCGSFAASCARTPSGLPLWHAGRIATYALLGGLAGALGHALPGPAWVPAVAASALLIWFTLALAGLVPEPRLIPPGLARAGARVAGRPDALAQLLFGVVNGFLPCGLVYSALGIPMALADPLAGAATMIAFGAGTVPALSLTALGLRRVLLRSPGRRRVFAMFILLTGAWTIWQRARGLQTGAHPHHMPIIPSGPSGSRSPAQQ